MATSISCLARVSSIIAPAAADDACQARSMAPVLTAASRVPTACAASRAALSTSACAEAKSVGGTTASSVRSVAASFVWSFGSSAAGGPASRLMSSSEP